MSKNALKNILTILAGLIQITEDTNKFLVSGYDTEHRGEIIVKVSCY